MKAPAPELASKVKAQQDAGRIDIDLILTGSDGLAAGLEQNLWLKLLPAYNDRFPGLEQNYEPAALNLHRAQGQGFGVVINYYPSGPLLEYAPERVHGRRPRRPRSCSPGPRRIRTGSCMRGPRIPVPGAPS